MEPLLAARRDLPDLPEEVFTLWLDDHVRSHGWPPLGPDWDRILLGRRLAFWKGLRWLKQSVLLSPEDMAPTSLAAALRILDASVRAGPPQGDDPLEELRAFIASHGTLPAPLVLVSTLDGYDVADGNRRIAAMLDLAVRRGIKPGTEFVPRRVEAWIGAIRA